MFFNHYFSKSPRPSFRTDRKRFYQGWLEFSENKTALFSFYFLASFLIIALFASWIAPYDPADVNLSMRLEHPSAAHWFGTDEMGRDIFSRLVFGVRTTILIVFLITFFTVPIGVFIGLVAGYASKSVDRFLMRVTDVFLALPRLILALAFVGALGPGLINLVIAISLTSWTFYARLVRSETLLLRRENFVKAVKLQGANAFYILWHHILPLCIPSVIVRVSYDMAGVVLMAAGFGFLGLGVQPPLAEWGTMVASGQPYLLDHWWVSTVPGLTIFLTSLALNFLGDGLRDVIDPRQSF